MPAMADDKLIPLVKKNLLSYAAAAVGINLFRHIYVRDASTSQELDTMQDGYLSCASFLSTILSMLGLIDSPHSTVATTLKAMEQAGWVKIDKPRLGAVVHWPAGVEGHEHIGFYVGDNEVISNGLDRTPQKHTLARPSDPNQMPDYYLWHEKLNVE
jgi:hypothetical protein